MPFPARGILTLSSIAFALILLQQTSLLACDGVIETSANISGEYDPFHPIENSTDYFADIENTGDTECTFSLYVRDVPAQAKLGGMLEFSIGGTGHGGLIADSAALTAGTDRLLASHRIRPGERQLFAYSLTLPPGQTIPAGLYEHRSALVLHAAPNLTSAGQQFPHMDLKPISIRYLVKEKMSINIAGGGKQMTIDFGELTQGSMRDVRIWARSNQKFVLSAFSANGGAMVLPPPYSQSRIEYIMALNGKPMKFPADLGPFEQTGASQEDFDLTFTIGEIADKRAGLYEDEIIIEINAAP